MAATSKNKASIEKKKIILADDHPLMRQGIALLINGEGDLEVIAQAETVHEALEAIQKQTPDLVIADFTFRESNGLELIKDIRIRWPNLPVLVLTMHNEKYYAQRVLKAGARGYLTKGEPPSTVIKAIRAVLDGHIWVSQKVASEMLDSMVGGRMKTGGLEELSDREFEIFELLGRGMEMRDIALQFHLSIKTVETHRDNIRKKLGLDTSNELLKQAFQWFHLESGS